MFLQRKRLQGAERESCVKSISPTTVTGSILRPVVGITCGLSLFLVPYSVAGVFVRVFCFASLLL